MPDDRDVEILRLANAHYNHEGFRIAKAWTDFQLSHTLFAKRVNELIDDPEMIVAHPELVLPQRRLRAARDRQRGRRVG